MLKLHNNSQTLYKHLDLPNGAIELHIKPSFEYMERKSHPSSKKGDLITYQDIFFSYFVLGTPKKKYDFDRKVPIGTIIRKNYFRDQRIFKLAYKAWCQTSKSKNQFEDSKKIILELKNSVLKKIKAEELKIKHYKVKMPSLIKGKEEKEMLKEMLKVSIDKTYTEISSLKKDIEFFEDCILFFDNFENQFVKKDFIGLNYLTAPVNFS